jgi:hypothetical protein
VNWCGSLTPNTGVTLTFGVTINITGTGVITNTVDICDGVNECFERHATTHVAAVEVAEPTEGVYCGDLIIVPIRVNNVQDMAGFQIMVEYMTDTLQIEEIRTSGSDFTGTGWVKKSYDNISGTSTVASTIISPQPPFSGSGSMYWLKFRAVGDGSAAITINGTMTHLADEEVLPIPYNAISTAFTVNPRSMVGNAYLQGRSDHSGADIVYDSTMLDTTMSDGSYAFCPPLSGGDGLPLRVEKPGYLPAQRTWTVPMSGTLTLDDVTLLGGDPIGPQVQVTTPATCTPQVTVIVPGPPDEKVNVLDLTFVGRWFGTTSTDADWGPDPCVPSALGSRADINGDGIVNIFDLVLVGNNYGATESPWL